MTCSHFLPLDLSPRRFVLLWVLAFLVLALAVCILAFAAMADPVVTPPASGVTLDLTGIATSIIAGLVAILTVVLPLLINARIKDSQAAATLGAAVKNSLGAMEQAATTAVVTMKPAVTIPGVPVSLAPGVQYVLTHAGEEAARFGITPEAIAEKISAQVGLAKIAAEGPAAVISAPIVSRIGALANLDIPAIPGQNRKDVPK